MREKNPNLILVFWYVVRTAQLIAALDRSAA